MVVVTFLELEHGRKRALPNEDGLWLLVGHRDVESRDSEERDREEVEENHCDLRLPLRLKASHVRGEWRLDGGDVSRGQFGEVSVQLDVERAEEEADTPAG